MRLATDIFLPDGAGPFPVILERIATYAGARRCAAPSAAVAEPKPVDGAGLAAWFTAHGYAVVLQDCRGRHGSEGKFVKYLSDPDDGFDTCEWIVAQPWCDGRICTIGLSYGAHTQAALGSVDAPGVVAQVLDCGGFNNAWRTGIRQHGAFEMKQATWAFREAIVSPEAAADPVLKAALEAEDIRDWFTRLPWRPGHSPLRHHPDYEAYLFEQWTHGAFDAFWRQAGIWAEGFYAGYSQAACVHMSSWFDPYVATATGNYLGLKQAGRGPQRLILGPWTHGNRSDRVFGNVDFGDDAPIDAWAGELARLSVAAVRSCDQRRGVCATPPVRVFVMGGGSGRRTAGGHLDHGGRWISLDDWPPPGVDFASYYLHGDGRLDTAAPAEGAAPVSYDFDPAHPVPTIGGNFSSLELVARHGSFDQTEGPEFFGCSPPYLPLASRADVAVFQTPPLAAPVRVVGPIEIDLWVATDGPDTDFTAKLIDVHPASVDYPRGYAMLLGDGIARLRYAEGFGGAAAAQGGRGCWVRLHATFMATANLFLPGHRIRLDVSSSNFPKFDVNSNTGEPEGQARRRRIAVNTVFVDAGRAESGWCCRFSSKRGALPSTCLRLSISLRNRNEIGQGDGKAATKGFFCPAVARTSASGRGERIEGCRVRGAAPAYARRNPRARIATGGGGMRLGVRARVALRGARLAGLAGRSGARGGAVCRPGRRRAGR